VSFKDHFSGQAADYAKFRPEYPQQLFNYLRKLAPIRQLAWDCGTGNGQAAIGLASVFDRVIATDASEKQISNAQPHPRVEYRLAPAENCGLESDTVDLIGAAQALHWFDLNRFYAEARRVLKSHGVLAASAYNLLKIDAPVEEIVRWYYHEVVGPFWPPERRLVETFGEIPFPFYEISPPNFEMRAQWNLDHLIGYLRTWSASQRFMEAKQTDPVKQINESLRTAWGDARQTRKIIWPLTLRVGVKGTLKRPWEQ
jgi:SAM-dependent methyltransferase